MFDVSAYAGSVRNRVVGDGLTLSEAILAELDSGFESGQLPLAAEPQLASLIERQLLGVGEIDDLMAEPSIEEIWVNPDGQIYYSKFGTRHRVGKTIAAEKCAELVEKLLRQTGRRIDRATPFVDATLADGSRLHIVGYGLTDKSFSINIRKFGSQQLSLASLLASKMIEPDHLQKITSAINQRQTIIVAGGTNSGKTTLLGAMLNYISNKERVVTIEDTRELQLSVDDWVALQTRPENIEGSGEINMRRLVRESLRMRPDRLVIGEVRGAEAFDLLMALNSGVAGMATIHANSPTAAIEKLHSLPLLAGSNISEAFVQKAIQSSIDLIIYCQMLPSGLRRVTAIEELSAMPAIEASQN